MNRTNVAFVDVPKPVFPDEVWTKMFFAFIHYRSYGVSSFDRCDFDNKKLESDLAYWVEQQQMNHREFKSKSYAGELSSEVENQLRVLESIRFPFSMTHANRQEANLQALELFFRENGHCRVPQRTDDGLGKYVNKLREEYKLDAENRTHLTDSIVERLNKIQFDWKVKKSHEDAWLAKFDQLVAYTSEHEHCNVPRRHPGGLGKWVSTQCAHYKDGKLSDTKIDKLEKVGFNWVA
jgi:hypothetical protein